MPKRLVHDVALPLNVVTAHHPPLVVEVTQNDLEAIIDLAESVLYGDFDIVKSNICRSRRRTVGSLDRLRRYAFDTRDENHCEAFL